MLNLVEIDVNQIIANPYQPRTIFDKDALNELSQSIRENGIIQQMVVRQSLTGKYEIVAGERRFKAACLAGFQKVPCIVQNYSDEKSAEIALIENVQRENLTAIEEAEAYRALIDLTGLTQAQLASRVGKTQSTIANKLRLLKLPDDVKKAIRNHQLTERHARAMLGMDTQEDMQSVAQDVIERQLTVSETEKLVKDKVKAKKPKSKMKVLTPNVRIALNTVRQAVMMVRQSGIDVEMLESDGGEDDYIITLKVAKRKK